VLSARAGLCRQLIGRALLNLSGSSKLALDSDSGLGEWRCQNLGWTALVRPRFVPFFVVNSNRIENMGDVRVT
jgi:hypothetical protein